MVALAITMAPFIPVQQQSQDAGGTADIGALAAIAF